MPHGPPEPPARSLRVALATKLLHGWAQNRQQVRVPLALNLGRMPADQQAALLGLVAGALAACGLDRATATARLEQALPRLGASAAAVPPVELVAALDAVAASGIGPHGYAAVAVALDRRRPVERLFLDWLAARLDLPLSLTAGLVQRYRR
jgi:hypothetical protein